MTISIAKEERDALYERIVMRLNGINDVYTAVEDEDWAAAQKLGQEFSDLLRFVCDDLGWGEGAEERLDLSAPADVISRAAETLRDLASTDREHFEMEKREAEAQENEARYLQQTCERLLGKLSSSN
ncbi:MAG: hypothetical protein M3Y75_10295 [Actinomycetota bacterium]|nr:hypothetical protein [Actinomycetota bacterium]